MGKTSKSKQAKAKRIKARAQSQAGASDGNSIPQSTTSSEEGDCGDGAIPVDDHDHNNVHADKILALEWNFHWVLDMDQMVACTLHYYGLPWYIIYYKDDILVAPAAPGRMFIWFYQHVVYNSRDWRVFSLGCLVYAADLVGSRVIRQGEDEPRTERRILWTVRTIISEMDSSSNTVVMWSLHSARVLDFMRYRGIKYRTREAAMHTRLTERQIAQVLGGAKRLYSRYTVVDFSKGPDGTVPHRFGQRVLMMDPEHRLLYENGNR